MPGFFGCRPQRGPGDGSTAAVECWSCRGKPWSAPALIPWGCGGSDTGVFAGVIHAGYGGQVEGELEGLRTHRPRRLSVASGRVSYVLGLGRPRRCRWIRACSFVVGGTAFGRAVAAVGANATWPWSVASRSWPHPAAFVEFSRQRGAGRRWPVQGLCGSRRRHPPGRKAPEFLVVERLADARRAGHPVLALVRRDRGQIRMAPPTD